MRIILGAIVFILMALPLAWFYVAMYWGFTVTKDIAAFERGEEVTLPVFPPLKWLNERSALEAAFSPDQITEDRRVTYRIAIPFTDLLEPGEVMPADDLKKLYATLRAPARFAPLCDELLATFASACDVGAVDARIRFPGDPGERTAVLPYSEDGLAELEGTLRYVPSYDMGNPALISNGQVEAVRTKLLDGVSIPDTVEGRAQVMTEARALCDALRSQFGTCVIRGLTLQPKRARAGAEAPRLLQARAAFSILIDRTKFRRDAVQAALDEITTARLTSSQSGQ